MFQNPLQTQKNIYLQIELESKKLVVLFMKHEEYISEPYCIDVCVSSVELSLELKTLITKPATIKILNKEKKEIRVIKGRVYQANYLGEVKEKAYYLFRLYPDIRFLEFPQCRIFQNPGQKKPFHEVLTEIKKGHNSLWTGDLSIKDQDKFKKKLQFTQYNESDFHFIQRHLADQGFIYYFTDKMYVSYTMPTPQPMDVDYVKEGQDPNTRPIIYSLGQKQILQPQKITTIDSDYTNYAVPVSGTYQATTATFRYQEFTMFPGMGVSAVESKTRGQQIAETDYMHFIGASTYIDFKPTTRIKLKTTPARIQKDKIFRIIGVKHYYRQTFDDDTALLLKHVFPFEEKKTYWNEFRMIEDEHIYRVDQQKHQPPVIGGPLTAKVQTSDKNQEVDIDNFGRILVKFPWDNQHNSCRVRVMQPWAGNDFGIVFHPRKGMEVFIAFEEGDIDRPLAIGCTYNSVNVIPKEDPSISRIKTRSSVGGGGFNEIKLKDKKDQELFYTHAQKDRTDDIKKGNLTINVIEKNMTTNMKGKNTKHTLSITKGDDVIDISDGNQNITLKKGNRSVNLKSGNDGLTVKGNIKQKASKTVTIEGMTIEIKAQKKIILKAPQIEINGKMKVDIKGMKVTSKGTVMNEVSAGAMTKIKGGIVKVN